MKFGEPPETCATPRKAIGVSSPLALLVPTTTVSRVPVSVTCWLRLFARPLRGRPVLPRGIVKVGQVGRSARHSCQHRAAVQELDLALHPT